MVKNRILIAAGLLFAASPVDAQVTRPGELVDRIVAVVQGEPVLASDLDALSATLARQGEEIADPSELLERKIEDILIATQAQKLGIRTTDRELDERMSLIAEQNGISRDELVDAVANEYGISIAEYRELLREQMLRQQIIQAEIESLVNLDRADLLAFMKSNPAEFGTPPSVRMRVRNVSSADLRESGVVCEPSKCDGELSGEAAAELFQGQPAIEVSWADLEQVIQEWVGTMAKPEDIRIFPAGVGNWLVIEFQENIPGRLRPLAEVEEQVRARVHRQKLEIAFRQWLTDLKSAAWIERYEQP